MSRVLIIFAHPAFEQSRVNKRLVDVVGDIPDVTLHDLYEVYPDFDVDSRREQALLQAHDAIVFQHPFYWYSSPALLKQWMDLVLEFGWAYGPEGMALAGKTWQEAVTAGGPETAYQRGGYNHFTMDELLAPTQQTARLCRMEFAEPFVLFGTNNMTEGDLSTSAAAYRRLILTLRDQTPSRAPAQKAGPDAR